MQKEEFFSKLKAALGDLIAITPEGGMLPDIVDLRPIHDKMLEPFQHVEIPEGINNRTIMEIGSRFRSSLSEWKPYITKLGQKSYSILGEDLERAVLPYAQASIGKNLMAFLPEELHDSIRGNLIQSWARFQASPEHYNHHEPMITMREFDRDFEELSGIKNAARLLGIKPEGLNVLVEDLAANRISNEDLARRANQIVQDGKAAFLQEAEEAAQRGFSAAAEGMTVTQRGGYSGRQRIAEAGGEIGLMQRTGNFLCEHKGKLTIGATVLAAIGGFAFWRHRVNKNRQEPQQEQQAATSR